MLLFEKITTKDGAILLYIQQHLRKKWLTPLMVMFSIVGSGFLWIGWSHYLYFHGMKHEGYLVLGAYYAATILNDYIIKLFIKRPRPWISFPEITQTYRRPRDFSWPSGHTACGMTVSFVLITVHAPYAWAAAVISVLVAYSRMYNGHHYLSDVLGGVAEAAVLCTIIYFIEPLII